MWCSAITVNYWTRHSLALLPIRFGCRRLPSIHPVLSLDMEATVTLMAGECFHAVVYRSDTYPVALQSTRLRACLRFRQAARLRRQWKSDAREGAGSAHANELRASSGPAACSAGLRDVERKCNQPVRAPRWRSMNSLMTLLLEHTPTFTTIRSIWTILSVRSSLCALDVLYEYQ